MEAKVLISTGGEVFVFNNHKPEYPKFLFSDSIENLQKIILGIRHSCRNENLERPTFFIKNMDRWNKKILEGGKREDLINKVDLKFDYFSETFDKIRYRKILDKSIGKLKDIRYIV